MITQYYKWRFLVGKNRENHLQNEKGGFKREQSGCETCQSNSLKQSL